MVNQTENIETTLQEKKLLAGTVPTVTQVKVAAGAIRWVATQTRCDMAKRILPLDEIVESKLNIQATKLMDETTDIIQDSIKIGFVLRKVDKPTMYVAAHG